MNLKQFLHIVEIRTKIVSVSGLLIGTLLALHQHSAVNIGAGILMWVGALAIDMGTTAFNTFFDYWNRVDTRRFNRETDKVLIHDGVAPGIALVVALSLYAAGAIIGVVLAFLVGWQVLLIGALCMAVGFFYNGGPLPISRTPLGEVFAGGFLGYVLPLLTVYVLSGWISTPAWYLALSSLLMVASILTVNNTSDIVGDRAAGRLTLSIVIGPKASAALIWILAVIAYGLAIVAWPLGFLSLPSLIPLLLGGLVSIRLYLRMARRGYRHETKGPSMGSIARIFQVYSLAMAAAILVDAIVRA